LREHGGAFVQNVWRVGAEPAPPPLEEDAGDVAAEPAEDRVEPTLFSGLGEKVGSAEGGIGGSEHRRKLEIALDELLACRRIIDGVLQQD
jgi:hypothetical protein